MKKTITLLCLAIATLNAHSQSFIETFESFTLSTLSEYTSTTSTSFQGTSAIFQYDWDNTYSIWSGGFSYTNYYDSTTAGFTNLYGVKAFKGYNSSNNYVVGQDSGVIKLKAPYKGVEGLWLTNTTYAYKSMKFGDSNAKKFGGTSGNDPDFFKITIKGFLNGVMTTDSVEFYLADFRDSNNSLDYILDSWQYVNTMILGEIDSLQFFMYSSDVGSFGINTPLFFGMDNFTASPSFTGLKENVDQVSISVFPNPVTNFLTISKETPSPASYQISSTNGLILKEDQLITNSQKIDLTEFPSGIYFVRIISDQKVATKKIIKN